MKSFKITRILSVAIILLNLCSFTLASDIYHPVAYWNFDEGSGTIAHDTAGVCNGTLLNGASWSAQGKFGNALQLDGTNDYVEVSGTNDTAIEFNKSNSFTISVWAKPQANGWLMGKMQSSTGSFGYSIGYDGSGKFYRLLADSLNVGTAYVDTDHSIISLGTWSHVVAVYDNTQMSIYRDGILKDTDTFGYDTGTTVPDKNMTIGAWLTRTGVSAYFNGLIDDVRIYNYALSGNEVTQLYQVPEPATICLFGVAGLFLRRRK